MNAIVLALVFATSVASASQMQNNTFDDNDDRTTEDYVLPDIYYVTEKKEYNYFPETTLDSGITFKQVDISDDIMHFGLNRNIHLEDYMEKKGDMKLVVKDLEDVSPFAIQINPKRRVVFVVDNKRVQRYFHKERKNLLQLALTIDMLDPEVAHAFYYRLSGALDNGERKRHSFLRRVIRNLARNKVLPTDLTIAQIEENLTDAEVNEYTKRLFGAKPYVEALVDNFGNRQFPDNIMESSRTTTTTTVAPRRHVNRKNRKNNKDSSKITGTIAM